MKKIVLILLLLSTKSWAAFDVFTSTKFGTFEAACSGYFEPISTWTFQVGVSTAMNLNTARTNTDIWTQLEPSEEKFNWTLLDQIVAISTSAGQQFVMTLPIQNQVWSQKGCSDTHCPHTVMLQYYQFVKRMVQHYNGIIKYWEVWNEPNINWNNNTVANFTTDPKAYLDILKTAYRAVKDVDPTSTVIIGATAFPESTTSYLDALMKLGAGAYFDKYNLHLYGANPSSSIDPNIGIATGINNVVAIMNKYSQVKPMWVTEISITGSRFTDMVPTGTEPQKATYLNENFTVLLSTPNIERIIWHTLRNCGSDVGVSPNFDFGMYDFNMSSFPVTTAWKAYQIRLLNYVPQGGVGNSTFSNYKFTKPGVNDRFVLWSNISSAIGASPGPYSSLAVTDMFNVVTTTYSAAAFPFVTFYSTSPVFIEGIP